MKANEYIKEYGWDVAKKAVSICNYGYGIDLDELKRLVESWELVVKLGGLYMAKADTIDLDDWEEASPYWVKIKRAIEDVESCQ